MFWRNRQMCIFSSTYFSTFSFTYPTVNPSSYKQAWEQTNIPIPLHVSTSSRRLACNNSSYRIQTILLYIMTHQMRSVLCDKYIILNRIKFCILPLQQTSQTLTTFQAKRKVNFIYFRKITAFLAYYQELCSLRTAFVLVVGLWLFFF